MFYKKQKNIETKINRYLERLEDIIFMLREAVRAYLEGNKSFETRVKKIETMEQELDQLRREIQLSLFKKFLMPEMREDVLYLMNSLDELPNLAEHAILDIQIEKPLIPQELHSEILALLDKINLETKELISATECLFSDLTSVRRHANEAIREESEADDMELDLIKNIFSMNLELAHKIQLKTVIRSLADIADKAEDTADIIMILAIKRAE